MNKSSLLTLASWEAFLPPLLLNNRVFSINPECFSPTSQHLCSLCIPWTVDPTHGLQGLAGIFVIHFLRYFLHFLQALGDLTRSFSLYFPFPAREVGALMDLDPLPWGTGSFSRLWESCWQFPETKPSIWRLWRVRVSKLGQLQVGRQSNTRMVSPSVLLRSSSCKDGLERWQLDLGADCSPWQKFNQTLETWPCPFQAAVAVVWPWCPQLQHRWRGFMIAKMWNFHQALCGLFNSNITSMMDLLPFLQVRPFSQVPSNRRGNSQGRFRLSTRKNFFHQKGCKLLEQNAQGNGKIPRNHNPGMVWKCPRFGAP